MHISQIKDRSAKILATAPLDNDPYHRAIQQAARHLASNDWRYLTQWGDAIRKTLWMAPDGVTTIIQYIPPTETPTKLPT